MTQNCINKPQLKDYALGLLDDDSSAEIEKHLAECATCGITVSSFDDSADSVMRSLRLKPSEIDSPSWIERLASSPDPENADQPVDTSRESPAAFDPNLIGEYRMQCVIGRGGMSTVFSARHERLGRNVAFKVLRRPASSGRKAIERFCREMRLAGSLSHPAIVQVMDAGESDGIHYLVMEQVNGIDLSRLLYQTGPLKIADACRIAHNVADALSHAHEANVIHRDIKPSNVMLDRFGNVKLLDFGLARLTSTTSEVTEHTTVGQLLGTLDYMAPEQANGDSVDERADIYSLGATLFRLLTGRPPHGRSSETPLLDFVRRLGAEEAPDLTEVRTDISPELARVVAKSLKNSHEERMSTAAEFRDALKPFTGDAELPVLAAEFPIATESSQPTADSPSNHSDLQAAIAELSPRRTVALADQEPPPALTTSPDDSRSNSTGRWLRYLMPLVALGLVWGITVVLKTPNGTVRIESEVDDVKIELVAEGEAVTRLQVNRKGKETEVRAGKYKVRIAGESDGLEVSPAEIVIRRGQQTLVTINGDLEQGPKEVTAKISASDDILPLADIKKQDPATVSHPGSERLLELLEERAIQLGSLGPDHPEIRNLDRRIAAVKQFVEPIPKSAVYKGKTVQHWRAIFQFETDHEMRGTAFEACSVLVDQLPMNERLDLCLLMISYVTKVWHGKDPGLIFANGQSGIYGPIANALKDHDPKLLSTRFAKLLPDPKTQDDAILALALLAPRFDTERNSWSETIKVAETIREELSPNLRICVDAILPFDQATKSIAAQLKSTTNPTELHRLLSHSDTRKLKINSELLLRATGHVFAAEPVIMRSLPATTAAVELFLTPMLDQLETDVTDFATFHRANDILGEYGVIKLSKKPNRLETLFRLIQDGRINGPVALRVQKILETALQKVRSYDGEKDRIANDMRGTAIVRALVLLTGRLPKQARVNPDHLPVDLRQFAAGKTSTLRSSTVELYPIETMEAFEDFEKRLSGFAFGQTRTRTGWIADTKLDPVICFAAIFESEKGFPAAVTAFGKYGAGASVSRGIFRSLSAAIDNFRPLRESFFKWLEAEPSQRRRLIMTAMPANTSLTSFLQDKLQNVNSPRDLLLSVQLVDGWQYRLPKATVASSLELLAASSPAAFSYMYMGRLYDEHPWIGLPHAIRFLRAATETPAETKKSIKQFLQLSWGSAYQLITDTDTLNALNEASETTFWEAIWSALELVKASSGNGASDVLKPLRAAIADGTLSGIPEKQPAYGSVVTQAEYLKRIDEILDARRKKVEDSTRK